MTPILTISNASFPEVQFDRGSRNGLEARVDDPERNVHRGYRGHLSSARDGDLEIYKFSTLR